MAKHKDIINVLFPTAGIYRRLAVQSQPPYSCFDAVNVFPDDVYLERERGGSRPPVFKDYDGPGGKVNLMGEIGYQDSGVLKRKFIIGGTGGSVKTIDKAGASTTPTGVGISSDLVLTGAPHNGKFYIAHGDTADKKLLVLDPVADTIAEVTASAGTIPTKCKIVTLWRDRIVLAEDLDAPNAIYMSKQGDPTDWNYGTSDVQTAVELSATRAGLVGQPVKALIPHTNNCLLIATETEFWVMRGDPVTGTIQLINPELGILGRRAWCHSPDGYMFCMTNDGLYVMPPGCGDPLHSISREKLPADLVNYNPDDYTIAMAYDQRMRGVFVFLSQENATGGGQVIPKFSRNIAIPQGSSPPDGSHSVVTHFFCDTRNTYGNDNMNPRTASFWFLSMGSNNEPFYAFSSKLLKNEPAAFIGTRGGAVKHFERKQASRTIPVYNQNGEWTNDDGSGVFHSYVLFGPFTAGRLGSVGMLDEIQATLAFDSNPVDFSIYAGDSAEACLEEDPIYEGSWDIAGTNYMHRLRIRCKFFYILISAKDKKDWGFENLTVTRVELGRRRLHYPSTVHEG